MQIAVTFRHMETDEVIKDHVKHKVKRLQKYFQNPREAHVVLSAEKFRHIAELTIVGERVTLNSQGRDSDLYAAIDQMMEKMERQVREQREKVKRKRSNLSSVKTSSPSDETIFGAKEEGELSSTIQRRLTLAKPMSLEEAVAQFDLSQKDFLVFMNSDSGQMNVLHRNKEGGIEWVEPYLP